MEISDSNLMANQFCNYYTNLGLTLAKKYSVQLEHLGLFNRIAFFFESATQTGIVETANSLRLNTAAGPDKIPYVVC